MTAFALRTIRKGAYVPRTPNIITTILRNHFEDFLNAYPETYAKEYGTYRLERINDFVNGFLSCGDYTKGMARIQCTNPGCRHEYFRPFSCKKFYLCPSCSEKRAILFGEHIANDVLLNLPHRQFVFTFPKILRVYFRNNKLFSEISQLINAMILDYYTERIGDKIKTASVIAYQTYGEFVRFNPHFHALVLEGCFNGDGRFIHIPITNLAPMTEYFRRRVIQQFLKTERINQGLADNLLSWKHSGFSIDNSVMIYPHDTKAKESLAQYMTRCPVSLSKIVYEPVKKKVLFHTKYNSYFKENLKVFDAEDFIAEVTQHIPLPRVRLVRYYGLYSSRSKEKWGEMDYVAKHGPEGWKQRLGKRGKEEGPAPECAGNAALPAKKAGSVWAKLISMIYEVDPLVCPQCGCEMKIIAVITDLDEVKKILKHLMKIGKSPPGIGTDFD